MVQPMRRNDLPRRQCIFILRAHFEVGSGKAVAQKRVELPAKYRPTSREEFMSPRMQEYFRRRLDMWRQDILDETDATLEKLRLDTGHEADLGDRAAVESERSVQLRTRDRARKLISKIEAALHRIEGGSYGYCEETAEPISIRRLEARPIATLSVEAQERHERHERTHRDG